MQMNHKLYTAAAYELKSRQLSESHTAKKNNPAVTGN
jgi:hypothetical protein